MSVSTVQPGQGAYSPYSTQQTSNRSIESSFNSTAKADTVHISEKAKEQQTEKSATGQLDTATEISYNDLPIEAFSLPEWFAKWIPDECKLELGELAPISPYDPPFTSSFTPYKPLNSSKELTEYVDVLCNYFQETLRDNGIESNLDYYKSIVIDKEKSEEVHQSMKKRLADDTRVMELMQTFDITL